MTRLIYFETGFHQNGKFVLLIFVIDLVMETETARNTNTQMIEV